MAISVNGAPNSEKVRRIRELKRLHSVNRTPISILCKVFSGKMSSNILNITEPLPGRLDRGDGGVGRKAAGSVGADRELFGRQFEELRKVVDDGEERDGHHEGPSRIDVSEKV